MFELLKQRTFFQLGDVDPDDLLSFLDPPGPDLSTPPSSGSNASGGPGSTPTASSQQQPQSSSTENKQQQAGGSQQKGDLLNLMDDYE